jgi:hypothetical protein
MMDSTKRWSQWSNPVEFAASEPDGVIPQGEYLRITEIMYNPAAGGDLEFIELQNIGPGPLDLSGVEFAAGLEFSFTGSEVTSLASGEYVVIVKSRALFEALYDTSSMSIAGEFGGKLDNGGDEIILRYGSITILQFTYQDYWYPSTDGDGRSLVIVDASKPIESWGLKESWKASALEGGSPGTGDGTEPPFGLRRPGDLNGDSSLDIADAIGLLLHLFLGSPSQLPCGDSVADPGNVALLDVNGDASVNVSDCIHVLGYLFRSGPPPALGQRCVRIRGCAEDDCTP